MTSANINDRTSPVSSRSDKTDKESESNEDDDDDEEEEGKNSLDELAHEDEMRVRSNVTFLLFILVF